MRVAIPLTGTRGDVQPAVALGLELRRRGHDGLLGAPPNLVDFATRAGLTAVPCGPDVQQLYSSDSGQQALAAGSSFRLMQLVGKQMADYAARMNREVIEVCEHADVIVAAMTTEDRAASVAEATGVPLTESMFAPEGSLYLALGGTARGNAQSGRISDVKIHAFLDQNAR